MESYAAFTCLGAVLGFSTCVSPKVVWSFLCNQNEVISFFFFCLLMQSIYCISEAML